MANKTARMAWAMLRNGTDTNRLWLQAEATLNAETAQRQRQQEHIHHDCQANRTMANRSNRRRQNPKLGEVREARDSTGELARE